MARSKHGFTLIEMVTATVLLALAVVGALAAITAATRSTQVAEQLHTSALLAQQKLTEIELQPDSIPSEGAGDFGEEYPGFRWKKTVEPTDYQNLYRVTLTIQFGSEGTPRERTFSTYLRNEPRRNENSNAQQQPDSSAQPGAGNGRSGGGGNGN